MIIVCEPLCKGISHEKVNSGFLYGLSLAFPNQRILFHADATHIRAIKDILQHDDIEINKLEFCPIRSLQSSSVFSVLWYWMVFYKLFSYGNIVGSNKVFFLSFSPQTLCALKLLKSRLQFAQLKFTIVLHGTFESIADDLPLLPAINLPHLKIQKSITNNYLSKLRKVSLKQLPILIFKRILAKVPKLAPPKKITQWFSVKNMMKWRHSSDYRYVALSPHVVRNASRYVDLSVFDIYTVMLPTVFVKPKMAPKNEYVKFAIFGYGDSLVLHNLAFALSKKNINKSYEIRVIGMDNRGTEGFPRITCLKPGTPLDRVEMESQAEDIDAFLILYDKTKYRLSCSGSILESLSMMKPIVHFDNDCINEFNKSERPIGFRCFTFDEFVNKIEDIIEKYHLYASDFNELRDNILELRITCAIEQSVPQIRASFSW